jgi:hypothetical protein
MDFVAEADNAVANVVDLLARRASLHGNDHGCDPLFLAADWKQEGGYGDRTARLFFPGGPLS